MKVVPQIIVFLVLLIIGWVAYDRHEAFRQLVDDIADTAGLFEPPQQRSAEPSQPAPAAIASHEAGAQTDQQPATPADEQAVTVATESAPSPSAEQTPPSGVQPIAVSEETPPPAAEPPVAEAESATAVQAQSSVDEGEQAKTADPASVETSGARPMEPVPEKPTRLTDEPDTSDRPAPGPDEAPASPERQEQDKPSQSPEPEQPATTDTPVPPQGNTPARDTDTSTTDPTDGQQPAAAQPPATSTQPAGSQGKRDHQAIMEARRQEALAGLSAARLDWHQGNHDAAINTYWQLLREYPNHPDFAGELGNIYFAQGQTEMAVNAYSEAFLRLLKNHDREGAMQVLQIVYNIDQEQAVLLREYLSPR